MSHLAFTSSFLTSTLTSKLLFCFQTTISQYPKWRVFPMVCVKASANIQYSSQRRMTKCSHFSIQIKAPRTEINYIKDYKQAGSDWNMHVRVFCQSPVEEETSDTNCLLSILNDVTREEAEETIRSLCVYVNQGAGEWLLSADYHKHGDVILWRKYSSFYVLIFHVTDFQWGNPLCDWCITTARTNQPSFNPQPCQQQLFNCSRIKLRHLHS